MLIWIFKNKSWENMVSRLFKVCQSNNSVAYAFSLAERSQLGTKGSHQGHLYTPDFSWAHAPPFSWWQGSVLEGSWCTFEYRPPLDSDESLEERDFRNQTRKAVQDATAPITTPRKIQAAVLVAHSVGYKWEEKMEKKEKRFSLNLQVAPTRVAF